MAAAEPSVAPARVTSKVTLPPSVAVAGSGAAMLTVMGSVSVTSSVSMLLPVV